ncbi:GGDEF domain-containing protein [Algicola sagamiensis]|uniref:GGDEF domain-containing protein n=1 Tax=Algicola sagamiensis TaxID=163869 RepID=UPI00035ED9D9|nr:GGDEF domain-containing protein [Algicola sagamiensis]
MIKQTEQTLLEQLRITEFEIEHRKALFGITETDCMNLKKHQDLVDKNLETIVEDFYKIQTNIPEISLIIGDIDTLGRLKSAQKNYIIDLFSGVYDIEYVNNRLRIGLVHKRIGVEPTLYLSAIYALKTLIYELFARSKLTVEKGTLIQSLEKVFMFDVTLVFETYIRSMLSEIEMSKEKSERYAQELEEKVKQRTQELEEIARVDMLTGLINVRYLDETLTKCLRAAERRSEPITLVYMDVDDFKAFNDTHGHQIGDEILRAVGVAMLNVSREDDHCFRYGGDEFCVVMPNCTEKHAQDIYVERLKKEIHLLHEAVDVTVGIAQTGPLSFLKPHELISQADERMYIQKHLKPETKISTSKKGAAKKSSGEV